MRGMSRSTHLHRLTRSLAAALALSLFAWPAAQAAAGPVAGDAAPLFVGRTLDGEAPSLANFSGKVVVVTFWASWCPPCLKELPILEGIQKTAGKNSIQVIAVNIESQAVFRRLAGRLASLELMLAHDDGAAGRQAYGVSGIPHMVIIGRDGRIVRVNRGYDESALDRIVADINRALAAP